MNKTNVTIIGAGSMGTAMALLLADSGHETLLWDVNPAVVSAISQKHENTLYLPGAPLPACIHATADLTEAARASNILVLAIPSRYVRSTLRRIPKEDLCYEVIVNASKGLEEGTLLFMSQVVEEELGSRFCGAVADFSGPSIALELSRKEFTAVMAASRNRKALALIKKLFSAPYFRVQTSTDMAGVELGGVMKNIYSIAIGLADGLSDSMNTRAFLLTQGLFEMSLLGQKMGARRTTFYGLSGIGDLVATCLSEHSRNRKLGRLLARGIPLKEAQDQIGQVTEGAYAAEALRRLAQKHGVHLPLAENVHAIVHGGADPKTTLMNGLL